jgi:hypothetical protein
LQDQIKQTQQQLSDMQKQLASLGWDFLNLAPAARLQTN